MAVGGIPEDPVGGGAPAGCPDRVGWRSRRGRHALGRGRRRLAWPGGPLAGRGVAHDGYATARGRHRAARSRDPRGRHRLVRGRERGPLTRGEPLSGAPGIDRWGRGGADTRGPGTDGRGAQPRPEPHAERQPQPAAHRPVSARAKCRPDAQTQADSPTDADDAAPTPTPPVIVRDVTKAAGLERDTASYGAVRADFDGDGWPDLFIGGHSNAGWLVLNDHGAFVDAPGFTTPNVTGMAARRATSTATSGRTSTVRTAPSMAPGSRATSSTSSSPTAPSSTRAWSCV